MGSVYDVIKYFNMMYKGQVTGLYLPGFNPVASFPTKTRWSAARSKLKYMVVIDPVGDRNLDLLAKPRRVERC